MTPTTHPPTPAPTHGPDKAITLALSLAQAEKAIHKFASDQVDAIVDPDGKAYLLRPAQEHLRQNERRLQAIIDSAADVITVVNRNGVILSQSRAVKRLFGYEPEELVGKSLFELIYEENLDRLYTAFFNVIEGFEEHAAVPFYHPASDGTYRLVEASVGKLGDISSSVVLILRPIGSLSREHTRPAARYRPHTEEIRDCIILSHDRRMPLRDLRIGPGTANL